MTHFLEINDVTVKFKVGSTIAARLKGGATGANLSSVTSGIHRGDDRTHWKAPVRDHCRPALPFMQAFRSSLTRSHPLP